MNTSHWVSNTVEARKALVEKVMKESYTSFYIKKHPDLREEVDKVVATTIRNLRSGEFEELRLAPQSSG